MWPKPPRISTATHEHAFVGGNKKYGNTTHKITNTGSSQISSPSIQTKMLSAKIRPCQKKT